MSRLSGSPAAWPRVNILLLFGEAVLLGEVGTDVVDPLSELADELVPLFVPPQALSQTLDNTSKSSASNILVWERSSFMARLFGG